MTHPPTGGFNGLPGDTQQQGSILFIGTSHYHFKIVCIHCKLHINYKPKSKKLKVLSIIMIKKSDGTF